MELMGMEKKRVWMAFCTAMIILMTCTVLSFRIENLMKLDVNTCTVIKDEKLTLEYQSRMEEQIGYLPLSCYQWDEDSEFTVYYAEKREGLFGEEFVAAKKAVYMIDEKDDKAIVIAKDTLDADGKPLKIIRDVSCSRNIREGDLLVVDQKDTADPVGQIRVIACMAAITLPGILLLIRSVKKLGLVQEGNTKAGIKGIIFILIWLCGIFLLTGKLQIPRQYLPPEYIFDIPFYINECKKFQIWSIYKREVSVAGVAVFSVWAGSLIVCLKGLRTRRMSAS